MSTKIIKQIQVSDTTNAQNSGTYPLGADAANVYITNKNPAVSVADVIGDINLTANGSIAKQLNKIENYLNVIKNAITYTEDPTVPNGELAFREIQGVKDGKEITLNDVITNKLEDVQNDYDTKIGTITQSLEDTNTELASTNKTLKSTKAELIETIQKTPITYYVATDGNDETGNGTNKEPFATVNHALEAGASIVCLFPGKYDQDINLTLAKTPNITITTTIKDAQANNVDRRVRFVGSEDNKFTLTFTTKNGQKWTKDENDKCSCLTLSVNSQDMAALKTAIGQDNGFLFLDRGKDKLINCTELNSLQDKHPVQRLSYKRKENDNFSLFRSDIIGLKRIPVSKQEDQSIDDWRIAIQQAVTNADYPAFEVCTIIEENNEEKNNNKYEFEIYVNHKLLGDLSDKTGYFLKADETLITQGKNASDRNVQSLILDGIEVYHRSLSLVDLLQVSCLNCKIEGSYGQVGGFGFTQVKNVFCNKCEVSFCGSGFNVHGPSAKRIDSATYKKIQSSILLTDCWIHDIARHGIMTQTGCVTTVVGGLVEYCGSGGQSGVMAANGGNCTCYNVYSRNNYYNFMSNNTDLSVDGTSYDTPSQIFCSNCISENAISTGYYCNTVKKDPEGNDIPTTVGYMTLSNCISQNDKRNINNLSTHKIFNLITLTDNAMSPQAMTMSLFNDNDDIEAGE